MASQRNDRPSVTFVALQIATLSLVQNYAAW